MTDGERLQLGRDKGRPPSPPLEGNLAQRLVQRYKRRRRAKKARLAAMSRGRRVARRGLILGTWLLGFIAALMVAVIVMYYEFTNVPRPDSLPLPQVATIQYADGSTLARIGSVDRTIVQLNDVPKAVRYAVLAAEDRNFYTEPGVSIRGTIRAALSDLTGGSTQGGSGITQQYVKNAYLSNSQTLTRKLKELMIAVKLSREYSKDQILEYYLNTVYFGRNTYGIEAAAQAYFGEKVGQLTTAQGALLAAVLRAPSYYDPAINPAQSKQRWYYVLDGMVKTGHLSAAQEAAMKFPKTKPPRSTGLGSDGWKYLLVNAVLADLQAHGITEKEVYARGLTIRTTIKPRAQQAAVSAIHQTFSNLTKQQRNLKNALVAVDPNNGAVIAYYGGSGPGVNGYDGKVDYNDYAGRGGRPPGSSFKPYTLATALTQTLKHTNNDQPHVAIDSYVDGSYCRNIDGTKICNDPGDQSVSSSSIKLALAMKYSLNTTFDQLALDVGPNDVAATAHAMGIATQNSYGQKTLVDKNGQTTFGIGIGDYAVTPLDQATGFATLANRGVANQPYIVQQATASDSQVVYRHRAQSKQAIDPKVANDVTLTLEPVAAWSQDPLAGGRQSAAKTGTEGLSPTSPNNSDAWMVGYTPQVSAAVWVGTGYNRPIFNSAGQPLYGANLPGQAWKLFMDTYLAGMPNLRMASRQLIDANGNVPKPTPSFTPTPTPTPTKSKTPSPTFSVTSGFGSPTPTTPTPTPTRTTSTPSKSPTPSGSTSTCTGALCGP
ncbi:MAG TPA: transglycosylase domain-containing protein [Jatrophihabitans sp.]|nr:transglycosylase domain-containing protein [Jatrophihabitans sp.]